mmetsp:Transcript_34228/g.86578  ORF Transcript_34228/g.86578 Transcript_34228/m.86578 type:complete len:221 (+) Transcript_34228:123-785(+)
MQMCQLTIFGCPLKVKSKNHMSHDHDQPQNSPEHGCAKLPACLPASCCTQALGHCPKLNPKEKPPAAAGLAAAAAVAAAGSACACGWPAPASCALLPGAPPLLNSAASLCCSSAFFCLAARCSSSCCSTSGLCCCRAATKRACSVALSSSAQPDTRSARPGRRKSSTAPRLAGDTKFCVTAMVSVSRFRHACHQPRGTYTTSPGLATHSMGLTLPSRASS